jgi:REP element-mobilizing transposase RayT
MPRQVRIEFEGAIYHVMARGNQRNRIFASPDGGDENLFLQTLGECCERTGFRIWAWVLMGNHYHLLVETPSANLVAGMAWLQNTYTRRFNSHHRQWGRLFGDRYKSVLIESAGTRDGTIDDSYLQTLLDYIHLNPVRAGFVPSESFNGLLDYPWSSLVQAYAVAPEARVPWRAVADGLSIFRCEDRAADRRRFVERLESRMKSEAAERCGLSEIDGQTLRSTLRKGWYWGGESFKETLLQKLDLLKAGTMPVAKDFRSSDQARDHDLRGGERIISEAVERFGLKGGRREDFMDLPRGDLRRVTVAWAVYRHTSLRQSWIADRLGLHSGDNVSAQVRKLSTRPTKELSPEIRAWMKAFP